MVKKISFIFIFFSFLGIAQQLNTSAFNKLKAYNKNDTLRCFLLNECIEEEQDIEVWNRYNQELKSIVTKKLKDKDRFYPTYKKYLCLVYLNDGAYLNYKDKYKEAIINYKKSFAIAKKLNFHIGSTSSLQNIGTAYDYLGNLDSAIVYFNKAYTYAKLSKNQENLAYVLTDLGYVNNNSGNDGLAINYNLQALTIFEKLKDEEGIERTNFAIGRIFDNRKDYKKSIQYYNKCLAIDLKSNNLLRQSIIYNSLANASIGDKENDKALLFANKSLTIATQNNFTTTQGDIYNLLGDIYYQKNNLEKSLTNYQKAIGLFEKNNNQNFKCKILLKIAKINLVQNNISLAKSNALKSYEDSKKNKYPSNLKEVAALLSKIYYKEKNFQEAYNFQEIEKKITDSIYFDENKDIALKAEYKYENEKKQSKIKALSQAKKITELENKRQKTTLSLLLIGIISLLITGYLLFKRYKTNKQNQLLKVEIEKSLAEKKASESELKALKSQMNPHFIFNALNSIQEQFMFGDKVIANEQMGNFTDLTRQILTVSGKKKIPIATEIEILTKYLELEKMRFDTNFEYKISFSSLIDEDYHQIPPMLIQPFAENSLKHGLLHKEGLKKLTIYFDLDSKEEFITCLIEDNGIGREKSALINSKNEKKYESFSTDSINQRLSILNKNNIAEKTLHYEDLLDVNGNATGTRVKLKIYL